MRRYTLAELEAMPTINVGYTADLKVDTGTERIWQERTTIADGEPFEHTITVERLIDGAWRTVDRYDAERARRRVESTYEAREVRHQLARGPAEGEDFYRVKVGASRWFNVTSAQLAAFATVLEGPRKSDHTVTCGHVDRAKTFHLPHDRPRQETS